MYAIPAIKIYETATGNISNTPIIVRHFPLTSSTTSTKLTIVTPIDAKPRIIRITMNIVNDVEIATRIPVKVYEFIKHNVHHTVYRQTMLLETGYDIWGFYFDFFFN